MTCDLYAYLQDGLSRLKVFYDIQAEGAAAMKLLLFTVCVAASLAVVLTVDLPLPGNPKNAHAACRITCFRVLTMNKIHLSRMEGQDFPEMDDMVDMLEKKFEKCFGYCDNIPH
ncbi:hypothetical protein LSAT2_032027 [Lamellibrachia satsuma]|nr:hypothetical protein LSAT2_032027 [Lamellibrachia satsuma]